MFVVHGRYAFGKRKAAYGNTQCRACGATAIAERFDSFRVAHVFFVPLIPLGRHREWRCTHCGGDPHARTVTSRVLKIILAVVSFPLAALSWFATGGPADTGILWGMRVGMTLLFGLAAYFAWNHRTEPIEIRFLPFEEPTCLYCNGILTSQPSYCPACRVERIEDGSNTG